jgi:hypothetical protein
MNRRNLRWLCGMTLLVFVAAAVPLCAQAQNDEWHYTLAPYMIFPGMSGTVGARGYEADVDVSASDILSNLQIGFNGAFAARRGDWGFGVDVIYAALGSSTDLVNVDPNQGTFTFLAMRRLAPSLDLTFGARWNLIQSRIEFKEIPGTELGGRVVEETKQWVDPVVGMHWTAPLGKRCRFSLPANVGGFGVSSKIAVDVFPNLQVKVGERVSIAGGWRLLYVDYETGYENGVPDPADESFRYDVTTTGPVVGMLFQF